MPVITIQKKLLFKLLGKEYEQSEFEDLCFEFGVELDDVVQGSHGEEDYKIEIPANRTVKVDNPVRLVVKKSALSVRPVVLCAVLRGFTFTPENYASFIDCQDKLHQNVCRKRSLASIGTHDLDSIVGPFYYSAQNPKDINFVPLNKDHSCNGHELMELLSKHEQLKQYLHLIQDFPEYPVIHDSNNVVLSLPPIINGDHSKITLETKNILIEVTALDLTKATIALETICTTYSQYCSNPFQVEQVEVVDEETGKSVLTPEFATRTMTVSIDYLSKGIGVQIDHDKVEGYLKRMQLYSKVVGDNVDIVIPPNRTDIIHACDILEDIAIGYGFNTILSQCKPPVTLCRGVQQPLNKYSDKLRIELALAGYLEALTFSLCSTDENYSKLNLPEDGLAVILANPASKSFQVVRTSLYPGLLKTLKNSKNMALPLKIFEVSDVVTLDSKSDTGASNSRCLCVLHLTSGTRQFEEIHGLLDRIMLSCGVQTKELAFRKLKEGVKTKKPYYFIRAAKSPLYLDNRCAEVVITVTEQENSRDISLGNVGILNPDVLANFEVTHGIAGAIHLNLEKLFEVRKL